MSTLHSFPAFHYPTPRRILFPSQLSSSCSNIYYRRHCYSLFSVASSKKSRASKKGKSSANLCNEIREFLSAVGFPEDNVPSLKEFSQHGRQDLANIVRRRGYKFIRLLLQTSTTTNYNESNIVSESSGKFEELSISEGQNEKVEVFAEDVSNDIFHGEKDEAFQIIGVSSFPAAAITISLQEKVTNFIRHGELNEIEYQDPLISVEIYANEPEKNIESEDAGGPGSSSAQANGNPFLVSSRDAAILNVNAPSSLPKFESSVLQNISSNSYISSEETAHLIYDNDLGVEKSKTENLAEVECLKSMLHQKEIELHHLKEQIVKEKAASSVLQIKAEMEMNKARELISEKEIELHAAVRSLSGLKEVEVQYSGDGETVELAGSFNGWHHNIKMDPWTLSNTVESTGLRKSGLWRTILWLYPGIYEIKFVVDGHWRIDPSRESISRDALHNNILKVDRR